MSGMLVKAAIAAGLACSPCAANAHTLTTIYNFTGGADGGAPRAGVIDVSGTLYGTTTAGGASNAGTVFAVAPGTGTETVVHSFTRSPDGSAPFAGLIDVRGTLYGTTRFGGAQRGDETRGNGVVFAVDIATGAERVLDFTGVNSRLHGSRPQAGVVYAGGVLYGTAKNDGSGLVGAIFRASARRDKATRTIYAFHRGPEGAFPVAGLIDEGGLLYGVATRGGTYDKGVLFSFDPAGDTETVLYNFGAYQRDGKQPSSALIYHDGAFFGTTPNGGKSHRGTVFTFNPSSGTETVLYSFPGGSDGDTPSAGLLYKEGQLYGTTSRGGKKNEGTVFKVDALTGAEKILASFGTHGNDGSNPQGPLIFVSGSLYGTTFAGGPAHVGTVFQLQE